MRKYRTEYPRWHGIYGIEFIHRGGWSDPAIRYRKYILNSVEIEESLLQDYNEYLSENGINDDDYSLFGDYVKSHKDDVIYYIEEAIEGGRYEGVLAPNSFIYSTPALFSQGNITHINY